MAYTEASLNINNEFEDNEVPVFYCAFEFNRKIDIKTGHIQGSVHAGLMQVVVEVEKMKLISSNDLDSGYIYQKNKKD